MELMLKCRLIAVHRELLEGVSGIKCIYFYIYRFVY